MVCERKTEATLEEIEKRLESKTWNRVDEVGSIGMVNVRVAEAMLERSTACLESRTWSRVHEVVLSGVVGQCRVEAGEMLTRR